MPAVDCSGILSALGGTVSVPVSRPVSATGSDDYGNPTGPAPGSFSATCTVIPTSSAALERAGLDTTTDWRTFYSEDFSFALADQLTFDGEVWVVFDVKDYQALGGVNWAVARRIE